jgi:hypothetical protein
MLLPDTVESLFAFGAALTLIGFFLRRAFVHDSFPKPSRHNRKPAANQLHKQSKALIPPVVHCESSLVNQRLSAMGGLKNAPANADGKLVHKIGL